MRACVCVAALLALAAASARRADMDFEFDDDADGTASPSARRKPRRYLYEPHSSLCRSVECKKRELCLLRDAFTPVCATKKEILLKGDTIVSSSGGGWGGWGGGGGGGGGGSGAEGAARGQQGCVGCGRPRGQFLCGSDNRTYSSLCRLDLHNCVRRPAPAVRLACRGFCPCRRRRKWQVQNADSSQNEVLPERAERRRGQSPGDDDSGGAAGCALDEMADRLLDWFSVLMEEARASPPPRDGFPADCQPEVRWMFAHLDTAGDGLLSAADLYALRHDERERCLRPFLASCGGGEGGEGGGGGGGVARAAWCACLGRGARPCRALARGARGGRGARAGRGGRGARGARGGRYVPACDARGYYRPRQCHAALGVCWCVDPHGVELPGSRTKGAPACPGESDSSASSARGDSDGEGAPADDEDAPAGSGDSELRF